MISVALATKSVSAILKNNRVTQDVDAQTREIMEHCLGGAEFAIRSSCTKLELELVTQIANKVTPSNPLAYVLGYKWFYGYKFYVNPHVLIPRFDSEILVFEALRAAQNLDSDPLNIIDICSGSGCLGLSLLQECRKINIAAQLTLVDIAQQAIDVAKINADKLGFMDNCRFIRANIFEENWIPKEKYHIILSNPPYIPSSDIPNLPLETQVEPKIALDGGKDGLDFYRRISQILPQIQCQDTFIALEIDSRYGKATQQIFANRGKIVLDLSGRDRAIIIDNFTTTKIPM